MSMEMSLIFERSFGVKQLDSKSKSYIERFGMAVDDIEGIRSQFTGELGDFQSPEFRELARSRVGSEVTDGGFVLEEDELTKIKELASLAGENWIYVIELNYQAGSNCLGFKYPITLNWEEISDESLVAEDVYSRPIRDWILFGENFSWFKLALNDEETPVGVWFVGDSLSQQLG